MPRDEDILQLVSPLCLSPRPPLPPAPAPLGGREESEGGSTNVALPNRGCQAHPWAGAKLLLHSGLFWGRGGASPGRQDSCQGIWKESGPAGPARLARFCRLP